MFKHVNINGPFVGNELVNALDDCQIYITDSKYDSCPNHVIEAISCGLPILYSNVDGGAKELCEMTDLPVGEIYNNFDELIMKIHKILNNYQYYIDNINKCKHIFNVNICRQKYYDYILNNIIKHDRNTVNILNTCIKIENNFKYNNLFFNNSTIKLTKSTNILLIKQENNIEIEKKINYNYDSFPLKNKIKNNKLNIVICSDENYFKGVFALLESILQNTYNTNDICFNFILDIHNCSGFATMLEKIENIHNITINKVIIYVDINILDEAILNSKCFNGGGHLMNIGNFSRLLIGEIFNYDKVLYFRF